MLTARYTPHLRDSAALEVLEKVAALNLRALGFRLKTYRSVMHNVKALLQTRAASSQHEVAFP
jgi:hypothetical protein